MTGSHLIGMLFALMLLVGRWSFDRVVSGEESLLTQPRFWLLLPILCITVLQLVRPNAMARTRLVASDVWLILLFAMLVLSIFWAPATSDSLAKWIDVCLEATLVVLLILCRSVFNRERLDLGFWATLLLAGMCLAAIALFFRNGGQFAALGGGPITFGRNMGLMGLAAWNLAEKRGEAARIAASAVVVLALLLIVMSGSRGALLSYCVGCIVLLLLANLPVWQKVAAVSVAATLTVWALTSTVIGEQASETFQRRVVQTTFENRHVSGRDDLWLTAHEMAMEKPVFGWGLNGFAANSWHYPHNIVLEVLVEVGLIGLSLLVLATMSWMCRYWRYRRVMSAAAAAAVMLALTSAQTSGDLYDSRCYFLLLVLATP